jgi:hypothetical protein
MTAACAIVLGGCQPTVTVNPIEVKPIYMTLDINLKVDRELDNFFDFEAEGGTTTAPASGPASAASAPAASPSPEGGSS